MGVLIWKTSWREEDDDDDEIRVLVENLMIPACSQQLTKVWHVSDNPDVAVEEPRPKADGLSSYSRRTGVSHGA
jgi:hypothetical protein